MGVGFCKSIGCDDHDDDECHGQWLITASERGRYNSVNVKVKVKE